MVAGEIPAADPETAETARVENSLAEVTPAWACPKDSATMEAMGRRAGAWRCPTCGAIFLDTDAIRRGRMGRPPIWAPVLLSVLMHVLVSAGVAVLVRWLRTRPHAKGVVDVS